MRTPTPKPKPKAKEVEPIKDSRVYVLGTDLLQYTKVSEDIPMMDGTFFRETFQLRGRIGPQFTTYFKLRQSNSDKTPPTFIIAERRL